MVTTVHVVKDPKHEQTREDADNNLILQLQSKKALITEIKTHWANIKSCKTLFPCQTIPVDTAYVNKTEQIVHQLL